MASMSVVKRRTKIIATIGPACADEATMKAMVEAGMDVARLNLSHGVLEDHIERLGQLRSIADRRRPPGRGDGRPARPQGPPRVIRGAPINLHINDEILLQPGDTATEFSKAVPLHRRLRLAADRHLQG